MKTDSFYGRIKGARLVRGSGNRSITSLLRQAARMKSAVRFLRLAMPEEFRNDVSRPMKHGGSLSSRVNLLISGEIPFAEFLLVNPASPSFLTRMDLEGKDNREIWRVRNEILNFAENLLSLRSLAPKKRSPCISLVFHRRELIWNLGIVGASKIVARAYHSISTGHDSEECELHLSVGAESRLAESLIAFYEATKADSETLSVMTVEDLRNLGKWPSLFKCNVVFSEHSGSSVKVLSSDESRDCEDHWLWRLRKEIQRQGAFHPPQPVKDKVPSPWGWGAAAFSEEQIKGVDGGKILHTLSRLAVEVPELATKARKAGGALVHEAFQALREFRACAEQPCRGLESKFKPRPYPWGEKLRDALLETRRILGLNAAIIQGCYVEIDKLSQRLKAHSKAAFRDANIKNRLFIFDPRSSARSLREWLETTDPSALAGSLRERTRDVDFEMCRWQVTEWDDPFHLLFCPFIELGLSGKQTASDDEVLARWWRKPESTEEREVMWETFLLRSLREFLRRLWYANVMPRTYQTRYSREPRDHFLSLAKIFAKNTRATTFLGGLIEHCWEHRDRLWNGVIANHHHRRLCASRDESGRTGNELSIGRIPKGVQAASRYHLGAVSVIREAFDGMLGYCEIEAALHEGRKRVDAVFVNIASHGFFHDLRKLVSCNYVFVECKNYFGKLGNGEVDQLLGRFSAKTGCFGFLCCRSGRERKRLLDRCKDTWRDDRGLIVILSDDDLDGLTRMSRVHDFKGINQFMMKRVNEVTLDR